MGHMITKNFSVNEMTCKCGCGGFIFNAALIVVLEDVRRHFGKSVTISSSTRCTKHNSNVGGKPVTASSTGSKHLSGQAADINVKDVDPSKVYDYLNSCNYSDIIGLGSYSTFTHVDTRGSRARW